MNGSVLEAVGGEEIEDGLDFHAETEAVAIESQRGEHAAGVLGDGDAVDVRRT